MPNCPNCGEYFSGNPDYCPRCLQNLQKSTSHFRPSSYATNTGSAIQTFKKNIGSAIQILACITLAINIIATIVGAIVAGTSSRHFNFGAFILILLGGLIVSVVAFMVLYGFGRLVESSITTSEDTHAMRVCLEAIKKRQEMEADGKE